MAMILKELFHSRTAFYLTEKTKEKGNLNANIEQIGVFVQGRTEERRKNKPKRQNYSLSNVFLT